jgi:dipicolinate synthase subunit A
MQKDTIIYVTDQRQKYLANMLGGEQTDCRNSGEIDYERVGNIVFPTPFSKLKLINSDIEKLKHNIIINNIAVWGGMMPERFPGIDRGCDFMRDETVIEQNAIVTAEATASIAIQKSIHGIYGSKVLVSGFGKCGKAIARVFSAMGAHVMVMARRKQREDFPGIQYL